jgi:hypothetical protein
MVDVVRLENGALLLEVGGGDLADGELTEQWRCVERR